MTNNLPLLITIITPSYNRAGMITDAIESVLTQGYQPFEHIIIDGGSTDGTMDALARYVHLRIFNEPDQGMYDALNKGLKLAEGEIVGLLNSDDYYEPNVFASIADMFARNPDMDAVIGGARVFCEQNGREETLAIHTPSITSQLAERLTLGVPAINAWFFRRRIFEKLKGFDLHYRIASDREFLIRFYLEGFKAGVYDAILYHYREHSNSLTFSDDFQRRQRFKLEDLEIAETYAGRLQLRKTCLEWHLLLTLNMAAGALHLGDIPFALKMSWRGWRQNPLWPLYFLRDAFRGASRNLRRLAGSF
jgi:glycosyltransferase involved in cell wall biosynthesis